MKVLLVNPPTNINSAGIESFFIMEPLALEYIGAGVKKHHDVKLIDLRIKSVPRLKDTLESFQPDIIGTTGYTLDVYSIREICAEAKKILPGILTVVGGHHASIVPSDFFEDYIDIIVIGEGVGTFKKICDCHEKKKSFADIENIYYRKEKNGDMAITREAEHPSLDSLPFPDRSLTASIRDRYCFPLDFGVGISYMASIRGSCGCIYNCNFCSITRMMNRKVYTRRIDSVIEELASIKEQVIFWVDDEFLLNPERTVLLAKGIEEAGIKKTYWFYARADHVIKNPECIEEWAKIGLKMVLMGLEAHSDKFLRAIKKGTSVSKYQEALRICRTNNVMVRGNFIIQPDFVKNDFKEIARFSREIDVDLPGFLVLTPFPKTKLYEDMKEKLITHNYNLFDLVHTVLPTKLPLKQFYKEYVKVYKKCKSLYKRIKILRKVHPELRRKYFSDGLVLLKKIKNAYLDY